MSLSEVLDASSEYISMHECAVGCFNGCSDWKQTSDTVERNRCAVCGNKGGGKWERNCVGGMLCYWWLWLGMVGGNVRY